MLRALRLLGADAMILAMAFQTELTDLADPQHPHICRAVRHVTGGAPFGLDRRVFISEWPLLISMTLNASRISSSCQSCLFGLETAMWIVAVRAAHRSFENLMVKGLVEIWLDFAVATQAKLRIAYFQHSYRCEGRLLGVPWCGPDI